MTAAASPRLVRLRFEAIVLGLPAYVVPPLLLVGLAALGVIVHDTGRMVTVALEAVVPLSAAVVAASILASEPALELQLGTPGGFRSAALGRLTMLVLWCALVSLVGWTIAAASGGLDGWQPAVSASAAQLTWLAPLLGFTVGGCLLGIGLRSRAAAGGLLASFWLAGQFIHSTFTGTAWLRAWYPFLTSYDVHAADWLANRLTLSGAALLALVPLALWLGAGEWLLGSEDR